MFGSRLGGALALGRGGVSRVMCCRSPGLRQPSNSRTIQACALQLRNRVEREKHGVDQARIQRGYPHDLHQ